MSFFSLTFEDQKKRIGKKLGTSDWITITQDMINQFGEVTKDIDPHHMDPDFAKKHSAFGKTIAYGFLTTSLLTNMSHQVMPYPKDGTIETGGYPLNYGFDKLRITGPVPVDSKIRAHFTLMDVEEKENGGTLQKVFVEVECDCIEKPVLIAEWLSFWVFGETHDKIKNKH